MILKGLSNKAVSYDKLKNKFSKDERKLIKAKVE
jgi:hypothetical protein